MSAWPQILSASARRRRRAMLVTAAVMAPFVALDHLLVPGGMGAAIGAAWTLAMLGGGLLQREEWPHACGGGVLAATLAGAGASISLTLLSGGSRSPFFGMLVALPPCFALLFPELPGMPLGTAVLTIAAGGWIRVHEGRSAIDVISWALLASAIAGLAVYAAALVRLHAEREIALERDRRQALEALARAEVARLQLEQLAEAGRLAAKVAHDVNGPLSAARSNLSCLLAEPDIPEDERLAALRETVEAVQKIIDTVGRLKALMWRAGRPTALEQTPAPAPLRSARERRS